MTSSRLLLISKNDRRKSFIPLSSFSFFLTASRIYDSWISAGRNQGESQSFSTSWIIFTSKVHFKGRKKEIERNVSLWEKNCSLTIVCWCYPLSWNGNKFQGNIFSLLDKERESLLFVREDTFETGFLKWFPLPPLPPLPSPSLFLFSFFSLSLSPFPPFLSLFILLSILW